MHVPSGPLHWVKVDFPTPDSRGQKSNVTCKERWVTVSDSPVSRGSRRWRLRWHRVSKRFGCTYSQVFARHRVTCKTKQNYIFVISCLIAFKKYSYYRLTPEEHLCIVRLSQIPLPILIVYMYRHVGSYDTAKSSTSIKSIPAPKPTKLCHLKAQRIFNHM